MMRLKDFARTVLPTRTLAFLKRTRIRLRKARVASFPALTENTFRTILTDDLGLEDGDTVFIHGSVDQLNLSFPVRRILPMIQEITGERGTLLFPTYPRLASYEFLSRGEIFDIRKTPSFTGLLSEIARRNLALCEASIRSNRCAPLANTPGSCCLLIPIPSTRLTPAARITK